jgi:hypothetical protein
MAKREVRTSRLRVSETENQMKTETMTEAAYTTTPEELRELARTW